MSVAIPDPALVVLVGASGSGKSTWAAERYAQTEIVSSDRLRAVVGTGEHDLDASVDAFAVLEHVVTARVRRGLTTVVDTLGLDPVRRAWLLERGREAGLPTVVVMVRTEDRLCRSRNAARDGPVPASALTGQLRKMREVELRLADEGWDLVLTAEQAAAPVAAHNAGFSAEVAQRSTLSFVLQVSSFPWGEDPAQWLLEVAEAAEEIGFGGLALMDHLIQIPQVGRAWDPIPDPWVTLGLLAGRTSRLQLGTLVSPMTWHRPGVLATHAATLDVLSGGRAFLGVGAGWWQREHEAYGIPFPPARERLDLLESGLETIRALWAPGTKAYDGDRVRLPETTFYPRPMGRLPIIVGGGGERRTLRIAATYGDACNITSDLQTVQHKVDILRRHCDGVGRDPAEVAVTILDLPVIGRDRAEVATSVQRLRGRSKPEVFAARHHAGLAGEHVGRYQALSALGVSTVFLAVPGLRGADDLEVLREVVGAFD